LKAHDVIALVALTMAASLSCSGHREPAKETGTPAVSVAGPGGVSAKDEPLACAPGKGDPNAACDTMGAPEFLADVNGAIDELVRKRPELFNLARVVGHDGYLALDPDAVYLGVAANLQAKGLCASWDYSQLQVKRTPTHSEQYDLLLPNDHLRRGPSSFKATCSPAAFPLDAADVIHRVRVGFYSIQCEDGRTPPRNGEGLLPVDCTGFVTATPKKEDDSDVDRRLHGPEITWELELAGGYVVVEDFPNVTFNKFVRGKDPGPFHLCATVQGHRGCLNAEVVP